MLTAVVEVFVVSYVDELRHSLLFFCLVIIP